jgi:hypothetical protein
MSDNYNTKLLNPKFELIEQRFDCEVPKSLKQLYSNREEVLRRNFVINRSPGADQERDMKVKAYVPIDENCFSSFEGYRNYIEIASSGGEGIYFIDPTQSDPEVFLFVMESYELFPLGLVLSKFIALPKRASQ